MPKNDHITGQLFRRDQTDFLNKSWEERQGEKSSTVECLGKTFESDDARRAYFTEKLREKLKDPEFRKMPGFPKGGDEMILELSDPPYYTLCPNPFIEEFLAYLAVTSKSKLEYFCAPFAADVSEGKNDPIYNLHSYHTKVPHKAIMRYLLHYTGSGDVVFDGFSGTGMTAVAASLCAELGSDRTIFPEAASSGARFSIISDLAPICSFIAYNTLKALDVEDFLDVCSAIVDQTERDLSGIYETEHTGWKVRERKKVKHKQYHHQIAENGIIDFTLYSDVVGCPECGQETTYYEVAVDDVNDSLRNEIKCPGCNAIVPEKRWQTILETIYDPVLADTIQRAKVEPVLINYSIGSTRFEKTPNENDLRKRDAAERSLSIISLPLIPLIPGKETQRNRHIGVTHFHHFFTEREHAYLARLVSYAKKLPDKRLMSAVLFAITATMPYASRMRRFRADRKGGGPLSGTLYISSLTTPPNVGKSFLRNAKTIAGGLRRAIDPRNFSMISTQSATHLPNIPSVSVDYIFTDPPFGHNFDYSELNFFWEAVLGVITNQGPEAIVSSSQSKGVNDYRALMGSAFSEYYRILKPGRWMTVEFSNTKAGVWNAIQTAIQEAGFVVAGVSALDKKQMSFKAVMTPTAVKQDLVISAYKPNGGLEASFSADPLNEDRVWEFVNNHLSHLPKPKIMAGEIEFVAERDPRILFDRTVAWFVQHGTPVPISSREFQQGLFQRFYERDGMVFSQEDAIAYDKLRSKVSTAPQLGLFVDDERSAIAWLQHFLKTRPSTYQDILTEFMKQLNIGWKKHEDRPELEDLLSDNFLMYRPDSDVPSQIHSYLSSNFKDLRSLEKSDTLLKLKASDRWYVPDPNKQADLQQIRERVLLREFDSYLTSEQKKLKQFRTEAVRVGFKAAWDRKDYQAIVGIGRRLPDDVLQEDENLLMYYDVASMRLGED